MKKALVVGGSNGIGLAISCELIERGYNVVIVDICPPNEYAIARNYEYIHSNLLYFDDVLFEKLSQDKDIEALMLTAGFGRIAELEYIHTKEIENILSVNAIANIKIIKHFYDRIKSDKKFYCGIMGSIAGLVSSPMFSVYSASKAAICRFVESVNIELECSGVENRILNISPGSVKGTRFNGGENDLTLIADLAKDIIDRTVKRETLFIPNSEIYNSVIERYKNDSHSFGVESYQYKKKSGRISTESKLVVGYLSGTFDLFHVGHLNLLKKAKGCCDYLIVGVHPDASHKGKTTFIPFNERMEIVGACKYVDKVVESCREDSDAWNLHHYNRLFVGSDYKGTERFKKYEEYFMDKNVEIVYFPYTQGTSSTQIRQLIIDDSNKIKQ